MPNDVDLWEVFALVEETDEPDPADGDFWVDSQADEMEGEP